MEVAVSGHARECRHRHMGTEMHERMTGDSGRCAATLSGCWTSTSSPRPWTRRPRLDNVSRRTHRPCPDACVARPDPASACVALCGALGAEVSRAGRACRPRFASPACRSRPSKGHDQPPPCGCPARSHDRTQQPPLPSSASLLTPQRVQSALCCGQHREPAEPFNLCSAGVS